MLGGSRDVCMGGGGRGQGIVRGYERGRGGGGKVQGHRSHLWPPHPDALSCAIQ